MAPIDLSSPASPVTQTPRDTTQVLKTGIGLCLSGGGYRAMLFHVGSIWRLQELNYLSKLDRISSVSGGSITAGVLALRWKNLANEFPSFVSDIRRMASKTIDVGSVLEGVLGPGNVAQKIQEGYDKELFHGATLQDLPDDPPRFVFNATSVQSGVLWRFSKPFMADYRVGLVNNPKIPLAAVVAASSAFPPILSPAQLDLRKYGCVFEPKSGFDLQQEPYISKAILTDGGVYDNMGLETVWKQYQTVLISDGGGHIEPEPDPHHDFARHAYRVEDITDNQVRSLRKRQVIDAFTKHQRTGTYWGIRTDITNYHVATPLNCPFDKTLALARIATRLKALADVQQEQLINWGYAVCDAAMRRHVDPSLPLPTTFPYPAAGVG